MTVYLVFTGGGSDELLMGVFSTRALADAFVIDYCKGLKNTRLFVHETLVDHFHEEP
jgi:hypothetical protein